MPSRSQQELLVLGFPVKGTDVSTEYELQPDDTTAAAANVRAYEPGFDRVRGGSRPGLTKAVATQVDGGAHLVQLLDTIVITDPIATGGGVLGGGAGGAGGGGEPPGGGASGDFSGAGGFQPTSNNTRPAGQGGNSFWYNANFPVGTEIQFVQHDSTGSGAIVSLPFPSNVTAGNLLLAVVYTEAVSSGATAGVSDSQGLTWSQVGSYVEVSIGGTFYRLSLWFAIANASAACTVTTSPSVGLGSIGIYEYRHVDILTTNDGNAQNSGAAGSSAAVSLPAITVGNAHEMVFVAVVTNLGGGSRIVIDDSGATDNVTGGTFVNLFAFDYIPEASNFTFAGHVSGSATFPAWVAVGGSFRHS